MMTNLMHVSLPASCRRRITQQHFPANQVVSLSGGGCLTVQNLSQECQWPGGKRRGISIEFGCRYQPRGNANDAGDGHTLWIQYYSGNSCLILKIYSFFIRISGDIAAHHMYMLM